MSIRVDGIRKTFGGFAALDDISLNVPQGELVGLLGPSGSGKTTLLRIIAGLEKPDRGRVLFNERDVTTLDVRRRKVGFVFQQYALFRHLTVADNVAFGLRMLPRGERPGRDAVRARVRELLELVQMDTMAGRYPAQLSGGQKQRVALARALALEPEVLLLDEPFGALDAKVRKELRRWLRHLHEQISVTSIFVTHDQEEAMEVSDQVVVMSQGHIEQIGSPLTVYEQPASRFVFDFLGHINALEGLYDGAVWQSGEARLRLDTHGACPDGALTLYLRPHEATLAKAPVEHAHLPVKLAARSVFGGTVTLELEPRGWGAGVLEVELDRDTWAALAPGRDDTLYLLPRSLQTVTCDGDLGPRVAPA
ncbi:MAG: TOBE-like domain-containing protein [Alloalcanivorax venustensis]|jgi:sulfate transport system ATP-binding protein|uniref:Sulfate ABC transporter ATPase n=2 Tax=Alloalcanivorax venustensis TaxID=172371 RepID=A0ABS0AJ00_9GAMM|nr:TOBE-like domain-containing protein [Alloalcanivorax venustensis]KXJ47600.1 MAG: sulfate ABC transporter ATP-binding protein [Alcanivorax sp. Nap_24]MAK22006.1 sulfate ABC transporter ATP-binding protein [Alcanivorax sp.]MCH9782786.1 TOBE-like domain-containing protein [Gammaproteobacteria bacterium]MEA3259308.1 TOBE-like domain-containing protein [Pseudomonadota bacterium]SMO81560.1 sulfate transport system ATP-binding protein [Alcanivorax sp. DSM 26295]|tara:strand:- start:16044 stop:17138 length:1095 start_codon:yes stop_codon:yes gene_type:complete